MATYIAPTTKGWTSQKFGMNPGGFNPAGGHTGEDIAIPVGTPLVAMADGVVVHSGYFTGAYNSNPWWIQPSFAGFVVTVDYGAYLSHYAHCNGSPVLKGQRVKQGQLVAYSGNTGSATTGPHLHWEVMPNGWNFNNGRYGRINPRSLMSIQAPSTQETDDMAAVPQAEWSAVVAILQSLDRNVITDKKLAAALDVLPQKLWAYDNPNVDGGDVYQILRDAAANTDRLAADVAKVAARAASEGLTEAQITEAVKTAISESVVKVDVSVNGTA